MSLLLSGSQPASSKIVNTVSSAEWMKEVREHFHHGPPVARGWLWKKGETNTSWRQRHFWLEEPGMLWYAEEETAQKPLGVFRLNEWLVTADDSCKKRQHVLRLTQASGGSPRYRQLAADTDEQRDGWIALISRYTADRKKQQQQES